MMFFFWFYFLLPLNWALDIFPGIDAPVVRLILPGVFLFGFMRALLRSSVRLEMPLWCASLGAFLVWVWLSSFWAIDPSWTWRKALFLTNFFLLIPLLASFGKEAQEKILQGAVYGAFLAASVGIGQFISQFVWGVEKVYQFWIMKTLPFFLGENFGAVVALYPSLLVNIQGQTYLRATAFFPDPHVMSLYVGMLLPVATAFWWQRKTVKNGGIVAALFLASLLSFSRGGYAAFVLMIFFVGILLLLISKKAPRTLFAFFLAAFVLLSSFLTPVGDRFLSSFSQEDGSNQERLRLMLEGWQNIQEAPFLGVGLGNYPLVVKPGAESREPIYAHNLYLDLLLETGMIGFFCFFLPLMWALGQGIAFWLREQRVYSLGLIGALLVYLGHSFFETPLFSVHLLPLLLLILVSLMSQTNKRFE